MGFSKFAGSEEMNYLIMKNGNALVGLFQGMFEGNILTSIQVGMKMHNLLKTLTMYEQSKNPSNPKVLNLKAKRMNPLKAQLHL